MTITKKTVKRTKAKKAINPDEYNAFISGLEIKQVFLVHSSLERFGFPEKGARLGFDIPDTVAEHARFDDGTGFVAKLPYTVELLEYADSNEPERFASISVTFEAHYLTTIPVTDELFDVFKDYNLRVNLWPYVREYVQSSSLKMGVPGLVMPVLKIL